MKKLFIIPILFAFAFSQPQSNQTLYTIYTNGKVFNNVVLHAVQDSNLLVNVNNSSKKNTIPIVSISRIKIKEKKPNPIRKPLGCVYGLGLGALGGGLIAFIGYFEAILLQRLIAFCLSVAFEVQSMTIGLLLSDFLF